MPWCVSLGNALNAVDQERAAPATTRYSDTYRVLSTGCKASSYKEHVFEHLKHPELLKTALFSRTWSDGVRIARYLSE